LQGSAAIAELNLLLAGKVACHSRKYYVFIHYFRGSSMSKESVDLKCLSEQQIGCEEREDINGGLMREKGMMKRRRRRREG
jgi:hypothetical protein